MTIIRELPRDNIRRVGIKVDMGEPFPQGDELREVVDENALENVQLGNPVVVVQRLLN